jgi:hypothetical protein
MLGRDAWIAIVVIVKERKNVLKKWFSDSVNDNVENITQCKCAQILKFRNVKTSKCPKQ